MQFYYPQLKLVRENAQKTQKEVAEYLRIQPQAYQRYEYGTREIPIHKVHMLAVYYGCNINDLVGEIRTKQK